MSPIALQAEYHKKLVRRKGVVGTGIGRKLAGGVPTEEEALIVFVDKKLPDDVIPKSAVLPNRINGIPIDIIEVGKLVKHDVLTARIRPIRPGYSCGHGLITAGTIGGVFLDRDGDHVILSNCHVLANENNANIGDPIFQPGPWDAPGLDKTWHGWSNPIANLPYVATLKAFVPLKTTGNTQDSAIAVIPAAGIEQNLVDPIYPFIDRPAAGWGTPQISMSVQKVGRTTGHTTGKILAMNGQFGIDYDFGVGGFTGCVVTTTMSQGGDSGSVIFDMNANAVAHLFAGSDKVTLGVPIEIVREQYGLQLWNAEPTFELLTLDAHWNTYCSPGSAINVVDNVVHIAAKSNQYCCLERSLSHPVNIVSCEVFSGTDGGATWGPGLVLQFPTEMLKINLRFGGPWGGYFNTNEYLAVGHTKPNTWYSMRIRYTGPNIALEMEEAGAGEPWTKLIELPRSLLPHDPIAVRIGKTDGDGLKTDYHDKGADGVCQFRNLIIN